MPRAKGAKTGSSNRQQGLTEELRLLKQIEQSLEAVSQASARCQRTVSTQVSESNKLVNQVDRQISGLTEGVLSNMSSLSRGFASFASSLLSQSVDLLSNIVSNLLSGATGGGGFWSGLIGGLFSFLPFFQEGGLVRGTEKGLTAVVGEKFTDELIIPMDRVPQLGLGSEPRQVIINEAPIHIDMTHSLVTGSDLDRAVYKAAERGRRHSLLCIAQTFSSDGNG
jgi:hypothetical protein